jgi:glycosyltransferase involved in cell wall biosynthesis
MDSKRMVPFSVVFYILRDWSSYHRRPMIEAFARNAGPLVHVLAVEPPFCLPVHFLFSPGRTSAWIGLRRLEAALPNLWIFRPWSPVPNSVGHRLPWAHGYRTSVGRQILGVTRKLGFCKNARFAYITRPDHERFLGLARETLVVYECRDDYSHRPRDGARTLELERRELRMLQRADLVLASSKSLHAKVSALHRNAHFMPNGVDFDLFSGGAEQPATVPPDLAGIPRPRIGYVGSIWPPLDFDLVDYLAASEPGWSFVLIGPSRGVPRAITSRPNVHFLGAKPYQQLPRYLHGIDVATLPRACNAHTDAMNPLKLWEYMAAGRPVVSTPLKEARILEDVVHIADDYESFRLCIHRVLTGDDTGRIARGVRLASRHSWLRTTRAAVRALSEVASAHPRRGFNTCEHSRRSGP